MMADPWFFTREMLRNRIDFVAGLTLDLGAGTQKYRHLIAPACSRYIAMDAFSKADVKGDAMQLPFGANVFDTVVCTQVIEHLPRPWLAIHEIHRVLRPGGHLLLSTPFIYSYHGEPNDYFRYTKQGLIALIEDGQLEAVEITPMGGTKLVLVEFLDRVLKDGRIKRRLISLLQRVVARAERKGNDYLNTPNHFVVARK